MNQTVCLLLTLVVLFTSGELTARQEDSILRQIIKSFETPDKRASVTFDPDFNNCEEFEPFPCKKDNKCISLKHVCDGNNDCSDKWDENPEVCIAYQRVPAEDLIKFVQQQANWLVPAFFMDIVRGPEDLYRIASALSTSQNIDLFQKNLGLSRQAKNDFASALNAVRSNDMGVLESYGMSPDSWTQVKIVFKNLIDSGLLD